MDERDEEAGRWDLSRRLPRSMQGRFQAMSSYVQAIIDAENESLAREDRLAREEAAAVKALVFALQLERFMEDATRASARAVKSFEQLGVRGFRVGNSTFVADSPDVERGRKLAKALRARMEADLGRRLPSSRKGLTEITREVIREVKRGRRLDRR